MKALHFARRAGVLLLLAALLAQLVSFTALGADKASGRCGANASWELNLSSGVLTIKGSGAIEDYDFFSTRWNDLGADIKSVVIHNGITRIGAYAFYNCPWITSVSVPKSVASIGEGAFECCDSLENVALPSDLRRIAPYTFSACFSLQQVSLPEALTVIDSAAFTDCYALEALELPAGVVLIGADAFHNCAALERVKLPAHLLGVGADAFEGCAALRRVEYGGNAQDWGRVEIWNGNDALLDAERSDAGETAAQKLREHVYTAYSGQQLTPYGVLHLTDSSELAGLSSGIALRGGSLPEGMELRADGALQGTPAEGGYFVFTAGGSDPAAQATYILRVLSVRRDFDSVALNPEGYRFLADAGHIYNVENMEPVPYDPEMEPGGIRRQFLLCEGSYDQFEGVYLDGRPLTELTDYSAGAMDRGGSWVQLETAPLERAAKDVRTGHVLALEFRAPDGTARHTVQYFYLLRGVTFEIRPNDADWVARHKVDDLNGQGTVSAPMEAVETSATGASNSGAGTEGAQTAGSGGTQARREEPEEDYGMSAMSYYDGFDLKPDLLSFIIAGGNSLSEVKFPSAHRPYATEAFGDVAADTWYTEQVDWVYQHSLMDGIAEGVFSPSTPVNVEQMIRVLARIDCAIHNTTLRLYGSLHTPGVPEGQWYSDSMNWASSNGLLDGLQVKVAQPLSRAELAVLFSRWLRSCGVEMPVGGGSFADEAQMTIEAAAAFRSLVAIGVFEGSDGNRMEPDSMTSRAEFAILVWRICINVLNRR